MHPNQVVDILKFKVLEAHFKIPDILFLLEVNFRLFYLLVRWFNQVNF